MIPLALSLACAVQSPPSGQELLDDMSRRAVDFFYQQSNNQSGFTKDRAANFATSDTYTVASVASTGFALTAMAVGAERGWILPSVALSRARRTAFNLRYVAPREHGWFYHWIDWQTGVRQWNSEVSTIDSAILFAGLIVAKNYFKDPTLTAHVDSIMGSVDWQWMLTDGGSKPTSTTFTMGWSPENGFISGRWNDYSEQLMLIIQGLGADPSVPAAAWSAFARPVITYQNIELIGGGPLFLHQMSHGFVNFESKRDSLGFDYWVASKRATMANRQYCITNPNHFAAYGPLFWGLTAADGPDGYRAYGAPRWGDDEGTVAPTCVAASIAYLPAECQAALDSIRATYGSAYGRYGFSNSLNPTRSWIDPDVIGIDLGMMMCGIENKRDELVHRMTMVDPTIAKGLRRAGFVSQRIPSSKSDTLRTP